MSDLVAYSIGAVVASVCVDSSMTTQQIEDEMNTNHPSGISSKWTISKDTHFKDGISTNPCQCENDPNRKHYLLNC